MITFLVILVLIVMVVTGSFYIVPQQKAFVIERLGKYDKYVTAGFHVKAPFIDRIAARMSLRIEQLDVSLETKTLDNVFVNVVASAQYRVDETNVPTAYYQLADPALQLQSYMEDALRSAIPKLTLDDAFAKKDDVALDVQETVGTEMKRFGFDVIKTLITSIDPSPSVKKAMDSINAAQREKEATRERAEAKRIEIVTQATADAEKTRLQGEGQANYRREIADGIVDQIKSLQAVGMDIEDVNQIVMFNQYLDVMRSLSESGNAKTVVLPASTPGGFNQLNDEITRAIVTGNEATKDGPAAPTR
ncbi:MAG: SPFH domain-containing protein [Atopobiaceae bacterium]|nr:SPFH domain-containing protein [Atopobiaceae bacterium]MCH4179877.1 SPFH domain-containing protein [Atopobiaceae bacterium]MCH4213628.1 SPFH domain-containing protein [Atopobiaceae bacterium]MCH4230291.1 SPFH domain-containing protein [Atopobiaceae bacterium]MCH4276015.1 SPFH domain-containing protein [Atopobiaceae bacterium]